jgi:hypothetical protein
MMPETRPASAPSPGRIDPAPVTFEGLFGWFHPAARRPA